MEFAANSKTGVHIYNVPESAENQVGLEPIVSLPPAGSAHAYAWSQDGSKLASCDQGKAIVWNAAKGYKKILEISPHGESGGARALLFSPRGSFLLTFEKYDKDKAPENMHVWDLRNSPKYKHLRALGLRSYTSGKITADLIQWTPDESLCLEFIAGEGVVVLDSDLKAGETHRLIPEPNASEFSIAPSPQNDGYFVALYIPEACNSWGAWDLTGRAGEVAIYHVSSSSDEIKKVSFQTLPRKLNSCTLMWNSEGSALLAQSNSDVDESGESYFGTCSLYWMRCDGKAQVRISGAEDGLVQDVAWSPTKNEFMIILGMMPATTKIYDGKTGKIVKDGILGTSRRNTIRWNQFGRFCMIGGFGALPGDVDLFDRSSGETLCTFRAALTVNCCWAPSGRHLLTCTTAPRMNEDNQVSVWDYNSGERTLKVDFKPQGVERTGGGAEGGRAAADSGAMLWAASWRPDGEGVHKDRAASPPPKAAKRVKGIPGDNATPAVGAGAYRPRGTGGGFSGVAAMMRGELEVPGQPPAAGAVPGQPDPSWNAPKQTWQEAAAEQKEWDKQKKKLAKEQKNAVEEAKEAKLEEVKNLGKKIKDGAKRLKQAKAELAEMEKLKDKDWDELTEEDEAQLEGELDLRAEIAELEKGVIS